jgi:LPS sulfotransferase NodH
VRVAEERLDAVVRSARPDRSGGDPQSYFRPGTAAARAAEWGLTFPDGRWDRRYVDAVVRFGGAGTGRFGMRIMWSDMPGFMARLRDLYPDEGSDVDVLDTALGVRSFVHLTRVDRIEQAVSLVLAEQTGLWHLHSDGSERQRSAPRYDHDEIEAAVRLLDAESAGWSRWFDHAEVTPLRITYEELVADTASVLDRVVEHLGGEATTLPCAKAAKLANAVNRHWSERFRTEANATPVSPAESGESGTPPEGEVAGE